MQLEFFPSRTLTLYLVKQFATRIFGILIMLVLVLQMLDLLSESGDILAHPGNGEAQLWTYVSMRTPQLIARFLPYSVLLATILTLATLNQNSEVVAMKAAGLSAHQVLAPLLITAAGISLISFAFNERVVTQANATLKAWQANDWGTIPTDTGVRVNVYLKDGATSCWRRRSRARAMPCGWTGSPGTSGIRRWRSWQWSMRRVRPTPRRDGGSSSRCALTWRRPRARRPVRWWSPSP